MSDARRRVTLPLGAVALLVLLLAAAPAAHGQEGAVEVRVAAQRLLDGRTEFALQERRRTGRGASDGCRAGASSRQTRGSDGGSAARR